MSWLGAFLESFGIAYAGPPLPEKLEALGDAVTEHADSIEIYLTADLAGQNSLLLGPLLSTRLRRRRGDGGILANRGRDWTAVAEALRTHGFAVERSVSRSEVSDMRQELADGTTWTIRQRTLSNADQTVRAHASYVRARSTVSLDTPFAEDECDPVSLDVRILFGRRNRYTLRIFTGTTLEPVALELAARAGSRDDEPPAVNLAVVAQHLRPLDGRWAFIGTTADLLSGVSTATVTTAHIVVPDSMVAATRSALLPITVISRNTYVDVIEARVVVPTSAGRVQIESLRDEAFNKLVIVAAGPNGTLPIGPGSGSGEDFSGYPTSV